MTRCSLSDFTAGYIAAALWASTDDDDTPLDQVYDEYDIDLDCLKQMRADCLEFFVANEDSILCDGGPMGNDGSGQATMAGYDFWLTRCCCGAGFWDGDWPEPHAARLSEAAGAFGNVDLYTFEGKIYC